MSRNAEVFARLKAEGRAAFMPYVMAGDPNLEATARLLPALAEAGADLIELGVPFSDPMADGPTNQRAAERALKGGAKLGLILELVKKVRQKIATPINLMGYYNPFFNYGPEKFCRDAAAAGVDGLIIPDLQPDDAGELRPYADAAGLDTIFLIAPTSTPARLERVAREGRGFTYAVSLTGVTGARAELPADLGEFIARAREKISLPLAVGFGIGTPAQVAQVAALAQGVIVGSAIVKVMENEILAGRDPVAPTAAFVRELTAPLRGR